MGSLNEGSDDPTKNGHHFIHSPETEGPGSPSSFTHSISSSTNREFSDLDPLVSNAVYGTLSTSVAMIQDEPLDIGREMPSESVGAMVLQILVPFLLAGFGTVMAGTLLELVQVYCRREMMGFGYLDEIIINGSYLCL